MMTTIENEAGILPTVVHEFCTHNYRPDSELESGQFKCVICGDVK